MFFRRFERERVMDSGSGAGTPASEPSVLQDVQSLIAEMESGGQASAPENPAPTVPADPPTAAAPEATEPPAAASAAPAEPTAPADGYYTDEQLAAFDGEYDRRDFSWDRVDPALRSRLRILESGTGKYRARLERMLRTEAQAGNSNNPNPTVPSNVQPPAATQPFDRDVALRELLEPDTMYSGLAKILGSTEGKQMLQNLGYTDPNERAIVSSLVAERYVQDGLIEAQEDFPELTADPTFTQQVHDLIEVTPGAVAQLATANAAEVFRVASARVVQARQADRMRALNAREQSLTERENQLKAKESGLTKEIEATNRAETAASAAAIGGGGGSHSGAKRNNTILEDVRELDAHIGLFRR